MNKNNFDWIGEKVIDRETIQQAVKDLAVRIDQDYEHLNEELLVIGVQRGAFIFMAELVMQMQTAIDVDFVTVRSYGKSTETSGNLELLTDLQTDVKGKHLLVVDDIVDTGLTLEFLEGILRQREPASVEYCCLFDKNERRSPDVKLRVKYVGMEVPNVFLMGYGLDGKSFGRNLEAVHALGEMK